MNAKYQRSFVSIVFQFPWTYGSRSRVKWV